MIRSAACGYHFFMHGGWGIHHNSVDIWIGKKRFQVVVKGHSQLLRLGFAPFGKLIPHGGNTAFGTGRHLACIVLGMDVPVGQHSNLNGHNVRFHLP
ncbi:hypothetical protein D3C75_762590 [compost metagenome]